MQDPAIRAYVENNPSAPEVSADDWATIREASNALKYLHPDRVNARATTGLLQAIPEVAGMFGSPEGRERLWSAAQQLPKALVMGLVDFAKTPGQVMSGEIDLNTQEGLDKTMGFGLGVALGMGRGVKVGRTTDRLYVGPGPEYKSFDDFMANLRGMQTREEIDAFMASRHPEGPTLLLENKSKAGTEALDGAIEVAQQSKTRERSPELFAKMAAEHDPGTVHIDGKAIAELYAKEGKAPVEGDGLLGFVPDLAAKVQAAEATGGEVSIPVADYIAHVDPTVHEGLKDVVRLHEDGVTATEAKEAREAKSAVKTEEEPKPVFKPKSDDPAVAATETEVNATQEVLGTKTDVFMNMLIKDGKALGITETELAQYSKKIANAEQNILDKSVEAARKFVARSLTPEWKRQEAAIRETVAAELETSGSFAAEKFLRENKITLGGDNVDANADALAPIFGFDNGMDLRRALTELETVQAADRKNVRQQLKEAIEQETQRRMEASHGTLAENIAKEARQIALADHTFDVLAGRGSLSC
jgi:hypothetical protein